MSTPDCPECLAGKHPNCDGTSWNPKADDVDACPCAERGHEAPSSCIEVAGARVMWHGDTPPDEKDRAALGEVIAAAKRHFEKMQAGIPVRAADSDALGTAVLGEVPQCNGRCGVQGYGEDAHPDFDHNCPIHGDAADETPEWCEDCEAGVEIVERSIETSGYEEQQRDYHVTRLSCGHEIAVEVKRR